MRYDIVETPGRKVVNVKLRLGESVKIDSQEAGKTLIAQLRAQDKKEKRRGVDYVLVPLKDSPERSTPASASSVRVTEATRQKLNRFIGHYMSETGKPLSQGEAVEFLIEDWFAMRKQLTKLGMRTDG